MHYLKCYTILFLIIPTLFLAGLSSSVSFGATDKTHIITPSKIICCKDDTIPVQIPLQLPCKPIKEISTKPTQTMKQLNRENLSSLLLQTH